MSGRTAVVALLAKTKNMARAAVVAISNNLHTSNKVFHKEYS